MGPRLIMAIMISESVMLIAGAAFAGADAGRATGVRFQAHRGGLGEYPENTMAAFRASWALGAVPELDLRTTKDGVFICLHDGTLARTTNARDAVKDIDVSALSIEEVRACDAGTWFEARFAGECVPTFEEVLAAMQGRPEREIYLDFKQADLDKLGALIRQYGVAGQIIYSHNREETCQAIAKRVPGLRTMLWIGGEAPEIKAKFAKAAKSGFKGLDQVQLHLHPTSEQPVQYAITPAFLESALRKTRDAGIDLEVLPYGFDDASLHSLLDLGIRWYATDYPNRFAASVGLWETAQRVYLQAHRGSLDEAPENTMAAFRHAWAVEGAVPETDVRTTADGVMVCMHDNTPARTTDAPASYRDADISKVPFEEVRKWDAGAKFAPEFAGEKVPALTELFEEMKGRRERQLYLDLKGVDLNALKALIEEYGVAEQVLFVHGDPAFCAEVLRTFPGARTMTWLSGTPMQIKQRFEELASTGFKGISQLQFHLRVRRRKPELTYLLEDSFLEDAVEKTRAAGVALQLRPFAFDGPSLRRLIDLGVRWYVADSPARFAAAVREAQALP